MKKKHIPAKKNAAPAKKKAEIEEKVILDTHIKRIIDSGMSKEEVEKLKKEPDTRIILCSAYSSFVLRVDKKVFCGINAINYTLNKAKIRVLDTGRGYTYVLTKKDSVPSILELLKGMGRIYVRKFEAPVAKEKVDKKPTANTPEVRRNAKKVRKKANKDKNKMRAFYAALRNGSVSKRIKIHNPKLAKEIEEWMKDKKSKKKTYKSDKGKHPRVNITNAEKRRITSQKKSAKQVARLNKIKATEEIKMSLNATKKAQIISAKKAEKEQSLNLAA